jgi:hypothetical protein
MKKKYAVEFIKRHTYYVEAENADEAEEMACDFDRDKDNEIGWVIDPCDEIIVEELGPVEEE